MKIETLQEKLNKKALQQYEEEYNRLCEFIRNNKIGESIKVTLDDSVVISLRDLLSNQYYSSQREKYTNLKSVKEKVIAEYLDKITEDFIKDVEKIKEIYI